MQFEREKFADICQVALTAHSEYKKKHGDSPIIQVNYNGIELIILDNKSKSLEKSYTGKITEQQELKQEILTIQSQLETGITKPEVIETEKNQLKTREEEIINYIQKDLTLEQIASKLNITYGSLSKNEMPQIYKKYGIEKETQKFKELQMILKKSMT